MGLYTSHPLTISPLQLSRHVITLMAGHTPPLLRLSLAHHMRTLALDTKLLLLIIGYATARHRTKTRQDQAG